VEGKLRCVNFRRVSDPRRAFRAAFRVTGISDYWYRGTMQVIVITLRIPQSPRENIGCTWEHLGASTTSLGAPKRSLGATTTSLGAPTIWVGARTTGLRASVTSLEAPQIIVQQSRKNIFGNAAGAPGNHSYYSSFNNLQNSCLQFVFSSMYQCISVSI